MRNSKREEVQIFINNAKLAAAKAKGDAAWGRHELELDIRKPAPLRRTTLEDAAERLEKAAEAAMSAATNVNPERFEHTELWRDVLDAHHLAMDASYIATGIAKALRGRI